MAALIIAVLLMLVAFWVHAYACALLILAGLIAAAWPGRARSHEAETMRRWHKRNR